MNQLGVFRDNNVTYSFCNKQQEYVEGNKVGVIGGVTSGVLRYPHLIRELIEIKKQEKEKTDTKVLILGPGLSKVGVVSSPHLHEITAAFSENANVTVVDIDDNLISEIGKSIFGSNERYIAESVLTAYNGHSVKKYSQNVISDIREYVKEIPEKVTQNLEIQKEDFATFKTSRYNYIFATQSLMYTFLNFESLDKKEERKNCLSVTAKYLGSLKVNGVFVVDEVLYDLMRKNLAVLPNPKDFQEAAIRWDYKAKNLTTPFTVRKIKVPNNTRDIEKNPTIFYIDQEKQPRNVSTTDLYLITRL